MEGVDGGLILGACLPHGGRQLSVRNVVPTLTSNKRQGLSLNGRCQAIRNRVLSWFRPRAVRPAAVCSRHYIAQHRGACSGAATSKAGEEAWLPSPWEVAEDIVGELGSQWCVMCCCLLLFRLVSCCPCGGGVRLPFIGQGESELHVCRTIQLHEEVWCAAP
jgi:hypothetical protein